MSSLFPPGSSTGKNTMKPPPPLNYIRSFECSARHLSFTLAANELGYTQAAVSNHVRGLEHYLGRQLFIRYPRSLKLTEMGEAFLPTLRQALDLIDHATEAIVTSARNKTVVISCPMSLAENWIAGCMAAFRNQHPEIQIVLHGTIWEDLSEQIADITISDAALRRSPPDWCSAVERSTGSGVCSATDDGSEPAQVTAGYPPCGLDLRSR
jgi:LysR family transcriptional regulator, glycine cleavage system transcriptional activator